MKTIRVAIVGQGRSGRGIHAEYLQHVPGKFTIAAVADPLKDRRDRAVREFGCDAYASHKPLLRRNDIDLVVNATPSHLHVPYTLEFLNAGFNVLCEKPLAAKVKDVDRLIAAQKKSGTVFAVFQQSRYAPYFQQVRKVIDSGVLGDLVQVNIQFNGFNRRYDWQTLTAFDGGNMGIDEHGELAQHVDGQTRHQPLQRDGHQRRANFVEIAQEIGVDRANDRAPVGQDRQQAFPFQLA